MVNAQCNYGVKTRRWGTDRRPWGIDVLENAIGPDPLLFRKVEGQKRVRNTHTWKYRFRQIGLAKYEDTIREIAATAGIDTTDVFGPWADWAGDWPANRITRNADFADENARDPWADDRRWAKRQ